MIKLIIWGFVILLAFANGFWPKLPLVSLVALTIWWNKTKKKNALPDPIRITGCYKPPENIGNKQTDDDLKLGYKQFLSGNDPDLLDMWPCLELIPVESKKEVLNWPYCWEQAGGKLYNGRMIARKDSSVWTSLSRFNLPYPPFDHNSGMGVRDVKRKEAESLGVIRRSDIVKPHPA